MEEDIHKTPYTPVESRIQKRLEGAIDEAEERIAYEAAHNSELLKALDVVHAFLKRHQRVCYGGTAMNAILPPKKRFYNPELDLPDYDFFTPSPEKDTEELVAALVTAGFKDVYHRVGIHEGTKKILVNFVAIADISYLDEPLYAILHERAVVKGGLRYVDPDILRMMMYLELSRPRGEVGRWEKVFERLQLINSEFPAKAPRVARTRRSRGPSKEVFRGLMDFCISRQRSLLTGGLATFYKGIIGGTTKFFDPAANSPIGFLTPTLREDAQALKESLGDAKLIYHTGKGELGPEYMEVRYKGATVALLFQETACHSFLHFPTPDGRSVQVASLDTLITMYYAIAIFTKRAAALLGTQCRQIPALVGLVERNRRAAKPRIPAFPLSCSGYQKGFATLMREKVERIRRERNRTRRTVKTETK